MLHYSNVSFTVSEKAEYSGLHCAPITCVLELFQIDLGVYKLFVKGNKNRFSDISFNRNSTFEDFKVAIESCGYTVVDCTGF